MPLGSVLERVTLPLQYVFFLPLHHLFWIFFLFGMLSTLYWAVILPYSQKASYFPLSDIIKTHFEPLLLQKTGLFFAAALSFHNFWPAQHTLVLQHFLSHSDNLYSKAFVFFSLAIVFPQITPPSSLTVLALFISGGAAVNIEYILKYSNRK